MDALNNAVDYGIIGLLLALSVWSVAVAVERWLFYRRIDLGQFSSLQSLEIALTRRLVIIGTVAANAPYIVWHDGRQYHHDRAQPRLKGDGCGITRRHPLRSDEQRVAAKGRGACRPI
jgi:hypothetical protein